MLLAAKTLKELKVTTDTIDRAFVKRRICMALFWCQGTIFC